MLPHTMPSTYISFIANNQFHHVHCSHFEMVARVITKIVECFKIFFWRRQKICRLRTTPRISASILTPRNSVQGLDPSRKLFSQFISYPSNFKVSTALSQLQQIITDKTYLCEKSPNITIFSKVYIRARAAPLLPGPRAVLRPQGGHPRLRRSGHREDGPFRRRCAGPRPLWTVVFFRPREPTPRVLSQQWLVAFSQSQDPFQSNLDFGDCHRDPAQTCFFSDIFSQT